MISVYISPSPATWISGGPRNLAKTHVAMNRLINFEQDAQLSHRDRAARCIIILAKSERLELEDNILRIL